MSEDENRVVAVLNDLKTMIKQRITSLNYDDYSTYVSNITHRAYTDVIKMIDELVKEQPAKKYRRFKYLDEVPFNIGEVIIYRLKGEEGSESRALITEISYRNDNECAIYCIGLGNKMLTTHECFADLEYFDAETGWLPFGVLEDEED